MATHYLSNNVLHRTRLRRPALLHHRLGCRNRNWSRNSDSESETVGGGFVGAGGMRSGFGENGQTAYVESGSTADADAASSESQPAAPEAQLVAATELESLSRLPCSTAPGPL